MSRKIHTPAVDTSSSSGFNKSSQAKGMMSNNNDGSITTAPFIITDIGQLNKFRTYSAKILVLDKSFNHVHYAKSNNRKAWKYLEKRNV